MQLNLTTFSSAVQRFASAARAAAAVSLDFTVGSALLALGEANAAIVLWLQWLIVKALSATRITTSVGGDVDTFVQQFGMTRLPASPASVYLTFARYTTGQAAFIPVGTTAVTADGTQSFAVVANTANEFWDPLGGYDIAAGTQLIAVPAVAVTPGSLGNVSANTINLVSSALPYVDTVTNNAPATGGMNAETDAALQSRFVLFVNSRTRGTPAAIAYAIESLQQGLFYQILENENSAGVTQYGFFTVILDDGSGAPPSSLLNAVGTAIEAVRGLCITFAVVAPTPLPAVVSMILTAAPGYTKSTLQAAVANAILVFVESLQVGQVLPYTRVAALAYSVPGVLEVDAILLNGGTANIGGGLGVVVRGTLANITIN